MSVADTLWNLYPLDDSPNQVDDNFPARLWMRKPSV
jgi:hypothetical protein